MQLPHAHAHALPMQPHEPPTLCMPSLILPTTPSAVPRSSPAALLLELVLIHAAGAALAELVVLLRVEGMHGGR